MSSPIQRLRQSSLALAVSLAFLPMGAAAQTGGQALFTAPSGLMEMPSRSADGKIKGRPYGGTSPAADWTIVQWNIPQDLPPFSNGYAANQYASVHFSPGGISLTQDASALPCNKIYPSGRQLVDEFDLFVQPVNKTTPDLPQGFRGVRAPLSQLSAIVLAATVTPAVPQLADATCKITRAGAGFSVVLTDPQTRQTFYYQLGFAAFHAQGQTMAPEQLPANWFFTGTNIQAGAARQFGFGDRIWTSYGASPAPAGQPSTLSFNILPQLKQLIAQGSKFGMDQDLSHWAVTGMYYGQAVFGHVKFGSQWQNVSLTVR